LLKRIYTQNARIGRFVGIISLYRETSQSSFMKRIHEGKKLNKFALDQLEIFRDVLAVVHPKCVVVSNAFGSDIVREHLKDKLEWDDERRFHWYQTNGEKVPMFFLIYA